MNLLIQRGNGERMKERKNTFIYDYMDDSNVFFLPQSSVSLLLLMLLLFFFQFSFVFVSSARILYQHKVSSQSIVSQSINVLCHLYLLKKWREGWSPIVLNIRPNTLERTHIHTKKSLCINISLSIHVFTHELLHVPSIQCALQSRNFRFQFQE